MIISISFSKTLIVNYKGKGFLNDFKAVPVGVAFRLFEQLLPAGYHVIFVIIIRFFNTCTY